MSISQLVCQMNMRMTTEDKERLLELSDALGMSEAGVVRALVAAAHARLGQEPGAQLLKRKLDGAKQSLRHKILGSAPTSGA